MKRTAQPCLVEPLEDRRLFAGGPPILPPNVADVSVTITRAAEGTHIPVVIIIGVVDVATPHPVTLNPPIPHGDISILIGAQDPGPILL